MGLAKIFKTLPVSLLFLIVTILNLPQSSNSKLMNYLWQKIEVLLYKENDN